MSSANDRRWAGALAGLDANLLVALDALITESNVTRAAKRVGVTQSAMSQTLGRLRRQFDDPILVKVGRHMELTPFASRIRARLHAAITELEAVVRDRPVFDPDTATERFVIATVDYLAMLLAPALRRLVATEAPGVRLAIHALDDGSISGRLAEGIVQLYVGVRGETERALETQPLHREELSVVVRPEHPLATAELTVEAYAEATHVHVSPRREAGSIVDRGLAAVGHTRAVAVEVPYFALLPGLIRGSDLIATVPSRIARYLADEFGLVVREPPLELSGFDVCMAWHPSFAAEPSLIWLRDAVARVAGADGREHSRS
ncbi:Nodulation protein D 2 [Enhygromyxa salina]|uniref:Nodulation protein D 2 n=1 Tax=Enhygromyxa salina TaxID=215803 RepID=A0A2S9XBL3_9BACT|nr:LysR family transcriptional regulator [Enhygromyxa salina]PRP90190.1 Nodulation protein D 2 [Enhygromyxa salina]